MDSQAALSAKHAAVQVAVMRFFTKERPVGLVVGVAPDRSTPLSDYWFFAEGIVGGREIPPDRRTIWQIGSITKTFTATMLALSVRDLSVGLTNLAQGFAPSGINLPTYDTWQGSTPIQLVQLATHTAGLPLDPRNKIPGGYPIPAFFEYLDSYALAVPPGSSWNYSNLGFGLLANLLVSLYSVADYSALLEYLKAIGQLGLPDTVVELTAEQQARRALGFVSGDVRARWTTATWPALAGSGALYSSLDDQMEWLYYNLGWLASPIDDLLPIVQKVYYEGPEARMALAWQYAPIPGTTQSYISKSGNTSGFTSYSAFDVQRTTGTVVLCNTVSVWPQSLVEEVLRIMIA